MVRSVEMYKKCLSSLSIAAMGACMLFTLVIFVWKDHHLTNARFFLSRTRTDNLVEIDFEMVTVNRVRYFLYRNETESASDVDSSSNYYIVPNVTETCEGNGVQLLDKMERAM